MAKSLEFGRSVLVMDADDSKLEAALKADEQLVTQSVNKMQGKMNQLTVSTQGTSAAAFNASAGMSAMSASAGLLSGIMGSTIARGVAAIQMLQQLKMSMAGVSATMLGGAGLIAAIILFREEIGNASRWIGETVFGLEDLAKAERAAAEALREFEAGWDFEKKIEAVSDQIRVLTEEGFTEMDAAARALIRTTDMTVEQIRELLGLQTELAEAKAAEAELDTDAKAQQVRTDKLANLRDQLAVLQGTKSQYDRIADAGERSLRIEIDRTREMQAQAAAAEAQARAQSARLGPFQPAGVTNIEQARTFTSNMLDLAVLNRRSAQLVGIAAEELRAGGAFAGMPEGFARDFLRLMGIGGPSVTRFGQGALELSAFAATGRGGGGVAGPDPVQSARIAKEDKRTKAAEATARNTERLAEAFGRWHPGAR